MKVLIVTKKTTFCVAAKFQGYINTYSLKLFTINKKLKIVLLIDSRPFLCAEFESKWDLSRKWIFSELF